MSLPEQKPDLEDSINVSEAHDRLVREAAACVREKRIAANGSEPISLWVIALCGVVVLIAGGILGGAGEWEESVLEAGHKHEGKFESLRIVHRHARHGVRVGIELVDAGDQRG
jgi:hypothetical protein